MRPAVSQEVPRRVAESVSLHINVLTKFKLGGTTRRFTRGGTTTQSATDQFVLQKNSRGEDVDVTPIPIYPWRQQQNKPPMKTGPGGPAGQTSSRMAGGRKSFILIRIVKWGVHF